MMQPPSSLTWKITCASSEAAQALKQWISSHIDLDRVLTDVARTTPGGVENVHVARYRLGDYFSIIGVLADSPANLNSFRLVFYRRPDAGRFWKDLLVNIIQEIETAPQKPLVALDSKSS